MRKLLEFIRSIFVFVLFVLLEAVAINYYAHSSYFTEARLLARSNRVLGHLHGLYSGVRHYIFLGEENNQLMERVATLERQVAYYKEVFESVQLDTMSRPEALSKYRMMHASVVSSTINRQRNTITINRGFQDGVVQRMTVLTPDGSLVGFVADCTEHYAVVIPVINTAFRTSGKLAEGTYAGSIYWNGHHPDRVTLDDLSRYAEPQIGQEVVTSEASDLFPADIRIGWIEEMNLSEMETSYEVTVRLAADLTKLTHVLLIENCDLTEMSMLQESPVLKNYYN